MKLILTSDTHYGMDGKTQGKHTKFWRKVCDEIVKEKVRALIWAGDLSVHRQYQLERTIEQARKYVKIPILVVRGNHDFWDGEVSFQRFGKPPRSFSELDRLHRELFQKFDIHHLESNPYVLDDVIVCGWDGWYGTANPNTNDHRFMFKDIEGCPMHVYMSNRAWRKFDEVMALDVSQYRKAIAVTHFNTYCKDEPYKDMCANLKFHDLIKKKFDVFCCGHNHQRRDDIEDGCRILNSGSDYNKPAFLTFEV